MSRVVIGLPSYGGGRPLTIALESLLMQTYKDFSLVVVDDGCSDKTAARVRRMAANDNRVTFHQNSRRLGMLSNWNETLRVATVTCPDATYFAWASDHDAWEPYWLEALINALDANPGAVLAYPLNDRRTAGAALRGPWRFDTAGLSDPINRFESARRHMVAGDMVYGLFRLHALLEAGSFPSSIYPDRLLLSRLTLLGEFVQVPMLLWHREMGPVSTPRRQRRTLFSGNAPLSAYCPWWIDHALHLREDFGTRAALGYAIAGAGIGLRSVPYRLLGAIRSRAGGQVSQ